MDTQSTIAPTYSVQKALRSLSGETEPSSWQLVRELLEEHGEYGGRRGEHVRQSDGPTDAARRPAMQWLADVAALFDPELVRELHGRLLILGLCRLDPTLAKHLTERGFLRPLTDELKEDFEALLLPEHAGDRAYRRTFLKLLQNKPVNGEKPRRHGFGAIVDGGPGLRDLAELCHRQRWNRCFTARYVAGSADTLEDVVTLLVRDLTSLTDGSTVGDLLPDPATDAGQWRKEIKRYVQPGPKILGPLGIDEPSEKFLPVGIRLVLLVEYRRAPQQDNDIWKLAEIIPRLPERVGIVLSGLGPVGSDEAVPSPFVLLRLPPDRELTRGQPLANDVPAGPDRLNVLSEVNAIAEAIALKDMKPPMVVGALGGWGAGKSFILHLIENRIQEIRCEPVGDAEESTFPFVGHPYLIRFDAWTYAKGNLWASLMQQVFVELDRQVGLEQVLEKELGEDLRRGQSTEVWRAISRLSGEERERLLNTDLGRKALEIVRRFDRGEIAEHRLWNVLEKLKADEIRQLQLAEGAMERARAERDAARLELRGAIDLRIERDARRASWLAVRDEFLKNAWDRWAKEYATDAEKGEAPTFSELEESIEWYRKLFKVPFATLSALILFGLAGAAVALLADRLLVDLAPRFAVGLSVAASAAGSVWTGLARFRRWATDARQRFDAATAAKRRLTEDMREELFENAVQLARAAREAAPETESAEAEGGEAAPAAAGTSLPEKLASDADITDMASALARRDDAFRARKAEVDTRRQRVGMAARHLNLLDFVRQRLEGRVYEDKLGLLHQVKSDLEDLSDALLHDDPARPMFPRGKPRIILLIDDLDRCPPDKVVEVLEAAQLLVKTPLFVVVIAMDVRYVTRALEKVYAGVLTRYGEPSGLDYIEKIIQIPYRVRPVSESAVGSFLWSQMSPKTEAQPEQPVETEVEDQIDVATESTAIKQGEESRERTARSYQSELRVLPTETLEFSIDDHELISQSCAAFDVSPRTMKRLVNVFKLLKIIWYRQGLDTGPEEDVKRAMLALLVIAARYPEPMRQLLHAMERRYAKAAGSPSDEVVKFLLENCRRYREDALIPQVWSDVEVALQNPALISQKLSFGQLHERHLHLVSTFSFVGESDPERQATLSKEAAGLIGQTPAPARPSGALVAPFDESEPYAT